MYTAPTLDPNDVKATTTLSSDTDTTFTLSDVEVETLRRAAFDRGLLFDPLRTVYSFEELSLYGLVREGYTRAELRARGIKPAVVSSLDESTYHTQSALRLATPFGSGIQKYELPIDMLPIRVAKTIFPPGSMVMRHVHPPLAKNPLAVVSELLSLDMFYLKGVATRPAIGFLCLMAPRMSFRPIRREQQSSSTATVSLGRNAVTVSRIQPLCSCTAPNN